MAPAPVRGEDIMDVGITRITGIDTGGDINLFLLNGAEPGSGEACQNILVPSFDFG